MKGKFFSSPHVLGLHLGNRNFTREEQPKDTHSLHLHPEGEGLVQIKA